MPESKIAEGNRYTRRHVVAAGGAVVAALATPGLSLAAPAAQSALQAEAVYFEETGHLVSGEFWRYWQRYGLEAFGYPICEPFEDGGVRNQYFQRARFELPPEGGVRLGLLGIEAGGAQAPAAPAPGAASSPDVLFVPETGHTVAGAFLPFYRRLSEVTGHPVSAEQQVPGGYIQYFARTRLEWDPFGGTRIGLLGSELAAQRGIDGSPVARPTGVVTFGEYTAAAVAEQEARRAFGAQLAGNLGFVPGQDERWVLVSIPQQRVTAYAGTTPVFSDLCSTGRTDKGLTTRGLFSIFRRVANEIMDSTTIGYPPGHPKHYRLENVLYTQYFNGGEALHYAWWHNNFGQPMSFGCVNLRLNTARWFWDWANIGTRVLVV